MELLNKLDENKRILKEQLPIKKSFDVIGRELIVGGRQAYLVFVDGFAKDKIMLYILETLQALEREDIAVDTIKKLLQNYIAYIEVEEFDTFEPAVTAVLSGAVALLVDGQKKGIILDVREYPVRSPEEPDLEKVTRGSRDGLVETIIFNTALIRRRIRDPQLIFEIQQVGKSSKTDVAIGYIDNVVDHKLLERLKNEIDRVSVNALVMAEKTLEEVLIKKKWYNPLPQAKFTERPDVVAAHLLEGHIAVIVDTSPSVMLLPATLFHFTQHAEDYYQNPMVGTYLRWVRFLAMLSSLIITPIWLFLINNKQYLPSSLEFLGPKEAGNIPLFLQFVILELGLDFIRIASIHTPNALSTSLSIIGALILSEFAVKVGWFIPETILYMAIAGIGTFANPSIEFAMAIRIFRLFLLILTGLFKTYGFPIGILIILFITVTTKTFGNQSYIWPLFPFDRRALAHILFRKPIPQINQKTSS
ncbi:MAG: stage sporulation protein [Clostridiales bacterium]|nr:stage sporulation protein [Clostridiales bacterium]MDK2932706.1 stage sporulation protein [Clostridiales bacterium]